MRKAKLTLHRKIGGKKECICGTKMIFVRRNGWVCPLQLREGETNIMDVYIEKKDGFQIRQKC